MNVLNFKMMLEVAESAATFFYRFITHTHTVCKNAQNTPFVEKNSKNSGEGHTPYQWYPSHTSHRQLWIVVVLLSIVWRASASVSMATDCTSLMTSGQIHRTRHGHHAVYTWPNYYIVIRQCVTHWSALTYCCSGGWQLLACNNTISSHFDVFPRKW